MRSISHTITDDSVLGKDFYIQGTFALAFFCIIILAYIFTGGLTMPFFLAIALCALIFFLPSYEYLGLICIIGLTMFFEKLFTLQPLIIGDNAYKLYPIDALMAVVFLAIIIKLLIHKKFKFNWPEIFLGIFFLIVCANMLRGTMDLNAQFATAFSSFKNYFWYPLIYFVVIYAVDSREKFKNFIKIFLLFSIGLIGFIVYGIATGQGLWTEFTPLSTEGTRILAFTHAFYLSVAILIALGLLIAKKLNNILFSLALMWIWLIGIVGSMMRHLWVALIIAVGALFIISPKQEKGYFSKIFAKNIVIIITLILLALLLANLMPASESSGSFVNIVDSTKNRVVSFLTASDDTSVSWRMDLWRDALHKWETNPFFGIGFGKQLSLETFDWQTFEDVKNIHNSPLAILVQTGIVGFVSLGLFILAVLFASYKHIVKDKDLRPYYAGIFAAIILFLLSSFFQPYLEANFTSIFLWMLLGLLGTSKFITNKNENSSN
ncbi:MAG: O-antigen ligase family protein [Candidatus Buchananbacteria bacterium]